MNHFDPTTYGPVFAAVVDTNRRRALDSGTPDRAEYQALGEITIESAFSHAHEEFAPAQPADREMAKCCLTGVWLLHDFLDESHTISQGVKTPSGAFWHAIMHRREGDFSNAKYWFRHVGRHPVYDALGQRAGERAAERGESHVASRLMADGGSWDPLEFVELVRSVDQGARAEVREVCLAIQEVEWELLFDYCYHEAIVKRA